MEIKTNPLPTFPAVTVPHTLSPLLLPPQGLDSSYSSSVGSLPNSATWHFPKGCGSSLIAPPHPLLQEEQPSLWSDKTLTSISMFTIQQKMLFSKYTAKEFNCTFLFSSPLGVNFLKPRESHSSTVRKGTTPSHTLNIAVCFMRHLKNFQAASTWDNSKTLRNNTHRYAEAQK